MKKNDLLVNTKKEIRSVLLPEQNGLPLRQFCKRYKSLLGSELPYKELGFNTVCDFLKSIDGEVVDLVWSHNHNDYHVKVIPDETTKHIDKLVQKQKPSVYSVENACRTWSRVLYKRPPRFSRNPYVWKSSNVNNVDKIKPTCDSRYVFPSARKDVSFHEMAQRIIDILKDHPGGINYKNLTLNYEEKFNASFDFKVHNCQSLTEYLEQISELQLKPVDGVMKVFLKNHSTNTSQELPSENSVQKDAVYNWLESSQTSENHPPTSPELNQKHKDLIPADYGDNLSAHDDDSDIYEHQAVNLTLKDKFKEILQRNPRGIFSKDFESSFKAFYGHSLNFSDIGYQSFLDLVDDSPDVFTKVPSGVIGNDWLLFDAASKKNDNLLPSTKCEKNKKEIKPPINLDDIAITVRRILLAHNSVSFVDEFRKLYEVNTNTSFNVKDMGFNDVTEFFQAIEEKVPLKLDYSNVRTKVCLKYFGTPEPSEECVIPFDSVLCDQSFTMQDLPIPEDKLYFPMYVGTVITPDLVYIQLEGKTTSEALEKLSNQLQLAYTRNPENGLYGERYRMQLQDIAIDAPCAAVFSGDYQWYRARITRIEETKVKVLFVDYGNEEIVTKDSLRYLKKDHFELPAQAIPVRLAYVMLAPSQREWNKAATSRIMALCSDKILMGKVIESELHPESTSVHIIDTNGPKQIDICAQLVKEGFAIHCDEKSKSFPVINERSQRSQISNSTQSYEAELIAAEVPNRAMIEKALNTILKLQNTPQAASISPFFSNVNPPVLNGPLPLPNFFPPGLVPQNSLLPSMQYKNPASFLTAVQNQMSTVSSFQNQQVKVTPPQNDVKLKPSHYIPNNNSNNLLPVSSSSINEHMSSSSTFGSLNDALEHSLSNIPPPIQKLPIKNCLFSEQNNNHSDMFPDDEDDAFYEICKQYEVAQRHVQRLYLKGGYKIHIILLKNVLYVSSCDIIKLFWPDENRPVLQRRLRQCNILLDCKVIYRKDYENIFMELKQFCINGSESTDGERISLYLLDDVLLILNVFGHSSPTIRLEIKQIAEDFNLESLSWQSTIANEEEQATTFTDSFALERLCLYDLTAAFEGLKYKRLKALKSLNTKGKHQGLIMKEINLYEEKMATYRQRMIQVKALCQ